MLQQHNLSVAHEEKEVNAKWLNEKHKTTAVWIWVQYGFENNPQL